VPLPRSPERRQLLNQAMDHGRLAGHDHGGDRTSVGRSCLPAHRFPAGLVTAGRTRGAISAGRSAAPSGDFGGGIFDGAHLVANFEELDAAYIYWDENDNLYSKIDKCSHRHGDSMRCGVVQPPLS
jgi:hypothetical protein